MLDRAGATTVYASLKQGVGGVTSSNDDGIWSNRSGSLALIARTSDAAPGLPAGAAFQSISTPRVNALGRIAFPAILKTARVESLAPMTKPFGRTVAVRSRSWPGKAILSLASIPPRKSSP